MLIIVEHPDELVLDQARQVLLLRQPWFKKDNNPETDELMVLPMDEFTRVGTNYIIQSGNDWLSISQEIWEKVRDRKGADNVPQN